MGGRAGKLFQHVFPPMSKFNVTPKCVMSGIRGKTVNQGGPKWDCLSYCLVTLGHLVSDKALDWYPKFYFKATSMKMPVGQD